MNATVTQFDAMAEKWADKASEIIQDAILEDASRVKLIIIPISHVMEQINIFAHSSGSLVGKSYRLVDPPVIRDRYPSATRPLTPKLRFQILRRDGYRCRLCGSTADEGAKLEVDHKHPVSKGGTNADSNLWTLCRICNAGKGAEML